MPDPATCQHAVRQARTVVRSDGSVRRVAACAYPHYAAGWAVAGTALPGQWAVGLLVGAEKFSRWINRFGFGRPTGVQFPAEEQGLVPSLDEYSGSTIRATARPYSSGSDRASSR